MCKSVGAAGSVDLVMMTRTSQFAYLSLGKGPQTRVSPSREVGTTPRIVSINPTSELTMVLKLVTADRVST